MESPSILTRAKTTAGFTLIEILIAITILVVIFSLGLFISFDFYKSYSFGSEKNVMVSILQKARDEAVNNINQAPHGVHFEAAPNLTYTIFTGASYDKNNPSNLVVNASYGIFITSLPFDVIFNQLDGSCASANCATNPLIITASDGIKSYNITINSEGRIDW